MKIESLKNCSGCHSCFSSCPKNAISMKENVEGFLYPVIDDSLCIKCGKCEKVCSVLNNEKIKSEKIPEAYAIINNDEKIRLESSSGGVFSAIAEKVIEQNGIVFGVKLNENQVAIHSFTDNLEGLAEFRGSKYVQSDIGKSFLECKSFLEQERYVLFTGTPCQIEGLKKFLGKNYENLLCMDIICHGVPSPKLWKHYVNFQEKKIASRVVKTAFRRKNDGWKQFSLSFTFANDSEYCASFNKDSYLQLFLKDVCLRESCYQCSSKKLNRVSDITVADFWGIQNELPEMDDDKGTSFVLVHSEKGKKIISELENCRIKKINAEIGIKYNPSMIKSVTKPKLRGTFYSDLEKLPFAELVKKYTYISFFKHCYRFVRRCLGKIKRMILR